MTSKICKMATLGLLCLVSPLTLDGGNSQVSIEEVSSWEEFHAEAGKCSMRFPGAPEHISETMQMPENGVELSYDAYISSFNEQSIFMLLIAQYPSFVDESFAQMSLEGFLNGILTANPDNQLIFADLTLVNGMEALDFFIRTGGVYFKGRAVLVQNSLYLMAMECEIQNYNEIHFDNFINSFKLIDNKVALESHP